MQLVQTNKLSQQSMILDEKAFPTALIQSRPETTGYSFLKSREGGFKLQLIRSSVCTVLIYVHCITNWF